MCSTEVLFGQRCSFPSFPSPFKRSDLEEEKKLSSFPSFSQRKTFEPTERGKVEQQAYFSSLIQQMSVADNETRAKILRKLAETVARENPARSPASSLPLPPLHLIEDEEEPRKELAQEDDVETVPTCNSPSSSCVPSFIPSPPPSPTSEPLSPTSPSAPNSPFSSPPSSPSFSRGKRQKTSSSKSTRRSKKQKREQELEEAQEDDENKQDQEDDEDSLGLKPTDKSLDLSSSKHTHETYFGKHLTVLHLPQVGNFLIGREVATLLRRQTFNMYRSMKLRGIGLLRAIPEHVEHFALVGVVKVGTHSVTLVPYDEGSEFIKECKLREIRLDKKKRKQKKSGLLELYLIANEFLADAPEGERERE